MYKNMNSRTFEFLIYAMIISESEFIHIHCEFMGIEIQIYNFIVSAVNLSTTDKQVSCQNSSL